jgi:hypothetical protein
MKKLPEHFQNKQRKTSKAAWHKLARMHKCIDVKSHQCGAGDDQRHPFCQMYRRLAQRNERRELRGRPLPINRGVRCDIRRFFIFFTTIHYFPPDRFIGMRAQRLRLLSRCAIFLLRNELRKRCANWPPPCAALRCLARVSICEVF